MTVSEEILAGTDTMSSYITPQAAPVAEMNLLDLCMQGGWLMIPLDRKSVV